MIYDPSEDGDFKISGLSMYKIKDLFFLIVTLLIPVIYFIPNLVMAFFNFFSPLFDFLSPVLSSPSSLSSSSSSSLLRAS